MLERSTIEVLRRLMKRYMKKKRDSLMVKTIGEEVELFLALIG